MIKGTSKIMVDSTPYYFTREIANYNEFTNPEGTERILVDNKGKVTHSTMADIIAWNDDKAWNQQW